jgi:hypothetical protein
LACARKQDPISKITRAKRDVSLSQAAEYLPCKHDAKSPNASIAVSKTEKSQVNLKAIKFS